MPASPALRISPGRGVRAENHQRGRSLESDILFREKDDDLALFNEVQNKERENFFIQSNDDFDDFFSTKLRSFSDYKRGISIPSRGESSDLLNAEGDKNDYDWLITPPETPLFASLDDETLPVSLAPRGRPRNQSISISRSSTMEKSYRSGRSSASPHRLSPSPQSGNSPLQTRSRPFSSTRSSPPPTLQHSPPSRRLSPPSKLTPTSRSVTPTPRRMSTGSTGATVPSKTRGTSPVKTARGNSASPKIRAWQSNIPGFPLEAPPNLRTSLSDRPASYVRGSSPASRNSSRSGRQSMSPTASRSVGSSHSLEKEQFTSFSRGSVVSSCDDDVDSQQSIAISSSNRSIPRNTGALTSNRAMGLSKKPAKILSSSAPKRSFDLALRQMERKSPQNMFRPLLSSVPSSTLYAGKANAHHRSLISRNSSITTSSNASSDQVTSGALDTEESEHNNQEDVTSDFVNVQCLTAHDEVFVMDQEAVNEGVEESPGYNYGKNVGFVVISRLDAPESQLDTAITLDSTDIVSDRHYNPSDVYGPKDMEVCSKCRRKFHSSKLVREGDLWLCQECMHLEVNSTERIQVKLVMIDEDNTQEFVQTLEEIHEVLDRSASIPESLQVTGMGEAGTDNLETTTNTGTHSISETSKDLAMSLIEKEELTFATQKNNNYPLDCGAGHQQSRQSQHSSDLKVSVSEGPDISLLLNRSGSSKRHTVLSKSLTSSNISYEDLSHARDSLNSMRSSIGGHSVGSALSSADLGSSRKPEVRMHRQLSWQKSDTESRYDTPSKHKRSISSLSGVSSDIFRVPGVAPSCLEDALEVIALIQNKEVTEVIHAGHPDQSLASECTGAESTCTDVESNIISKAAAELLADDHREDTALVSTFISDNPASHENGVELTNSSSDSVNEETVSAHLQISSQEEVDATLSTRVNEMDVAEVPNPSSLDAILETEIANADAISDDSSDSKNCVSELLYHSAACVDGMTLAGEFDTCVPVNDVLESTVVLEDHGGGHSRSLTLEEATDTILFCSSIVHDLAYEAANIAIGKDITPMELQRPTMTFVSKSKPDRRDIRLRTLGKRSSKSQKSRQRKLETEMDAKPPPVVADVNEKSNPHIIRSPKKVDSMNPVKLESKCNCTIM